MFTDNMNLHSFLLPQQTQTFYIYFLKNRLLPCRQTKISKRFL